MKIMKKVLVALVTMAMVMAMGVTVFAAGSNTITISNAFNGQTYTLYKLFDAKTVPGGASSGTGITYSVPEGKTLAEDNPWFQKDANGFVTLKTGADINSDRAAFDTWAQTFGTQVETKIGDGHPVIFENLEDGYYYITTTLGSLVTITSIAPDAEVMDKNTEPTVDKVISDASSYDTDGKKALAQVGTDVEYTATVTVGKGAINYIFHDTMGEGLEFNGNDSVTVTGEGIDASKYTILETPADGDTLTIEFVDGLPEGTIITITYSAKVTSAALQDDPANNTATISYGNGSNTTSQPSTTSVYNALISVIKQDAQQAPLAGAGFVLKNSDGKYYKLDDNGDVSWEDDIAEATEYMSDAEGNVPAFMGLANGVYTLVEKTVPAGYNKAADTTITIVEHDYTAENLKQEATVINNLGSELPSTGGIGETIFYVIGAILILGAGVILVTRRRAAK